MQENQLKILFAEVLRGYSEVKYQSKPLYIKHFDNFIVANASIEYEKAVDCAKEKGVLTQNERIKELITQNLWSNEKEKQIDNLNTSITSIKKTKSKEVLPSRKDILQKDIDKHSKVLNELLNEKYSLIDCTVENYANRKFNEFCVFYTVFQDKKLITPFFSDEDLEYTEKNELEDLIGIYRENQEKLSSTHLKKIACSTFFLNSFILAKDSVYEFYGQFVKDLTYYQTELYHHGAYFKNILTDSSAQMIPDKIRHDPELLVEWFENNEAGRKIMKNNEDADAVSYVGATKEDMEKLGIAPNNTNLSKKLAEKGGTMSFQDIIKDMHGG